MKKNTGQDCVNDLRTDFEVALLAKNVQFYLQNFTNFDHFYIIVHIEIATLILKFPISHFIFQIGETSIFFWP